MPAEKQLNFAKLVGQALEPFSGPDQESMQNLLMSHYLPKLFDKIENSEKITFEDFIKNVEFLKSLFGFEIELEKLSFRDIYNKLFPQNIQKTVKVKLDRIDFQHLQK